jgi:hypothetical protein
LKNDTEGDLQYRLIAEEVLNVFPELVIRDHSGKIQGVRYDANCARRGSGTKYCGGDAVKFPGTGSRVL